MGREAERKRGREAERKRDTDRDTQRYRHRQRHTETESERAGCRDGPVPSVYCSFLFSSSLAFVLAVPKENKNPTLRMWSTRTPHLGCGETYALAATFWAKAEFWKFQKFWNQRSHLEIPEPDFWISLKIMKAHGPWA